MKNSANTQKSSALKKMTTATKKQVKGGYTSHQGPDGTWHNGGHFPPCSKCP